MFAKRNFAWSEVDAIDVKEPCGLVSRGVIKNTVLDQGFIVDFDYPGHNADFVPYVDCVIPSDEKKLEECRYGRAVQTLIQRAPNQPWRWYPAKLLAVQREEPWFVSSGFAFVRLHLDDGVLQEVMTVHRVRCLAEWLPFSLSVDHVNPHRDTRPNYLKKMKYLMHKRVPLDQAGHANHDDANGENSAMVMLPEILAEIFSHLDVENQTKCQRVCHLWKSILLPQVMSSRVEIYTYGDAYDLATTLHKMVTKRTKCLILTGACNFENQPFWTMRTMLYFKGIKVPIIVLSRVKIFSIDLDIDSYVAGAALESSAPSSFSPWQSVCEKLVLHRVDVPLGVQVDGRRFCSGELQVPRGIVRVEEEVNMEVWIERLCAEINVRQCAQMERILRKWCWNRDAERILRVLRALQPGDPRFIQSSDTLTTMPALLPLRKLSLWILVSYARHPWDRVSWI